MVGSIRTVRVVTVGNAFVWERAADVLQEQFAAPADELVGPGITGELTSAMSRSLCCSKQRDGPVALQAPLVTGPALRPSPAYLARDRRVIGHGVPAS